MRYSRITHYSRSMYLHAWVEDLRSAHLIGLLSAHDSAAALDAGKIVDSTEITDKMSKIRKISKMSI